MSTLGVNFVRKTQVGLCDKIVVQDLDLFHKNNSGSLLMYFDAVRESILKGVTTLCKDSCSVLFLVVLMLWKCFDIVIVFPIAFTR
ncbi:hypothetical protein ATZ36_07300 [Candidatus Endomicrobiellum trichonymphae]|uniref:Uncharacterized protein n=1 Tax=Endomicrobium trichonymphae TaxID=1408204 RepID=A0A1E5IHD9_ENDTX|nr:hypothetical protein ATZ36_07300 [Candidatus Endomicrobium trichonymphae]